jgi:hypothetical protein
MQIRKLRGGARLLCHPRVKHAEVLFCQREDVPIPFNVPCSALSFVLALHILQAITVALVYMETGIMVCPLNY